MPAPYAAAADVLAAFLADAARDAALPFVDVAAEYLGSAGTGEGPVSTARTPQELVERFDEPLPRTGRPIADVAARLARDVVADANRLHHPMYVGHQVGGPLPAATWAEVVVAALNQSIAVQEMSPTATAVEARVIQWMADLAGLGPHAGGTFTSGGTEATFAALLAARSRAIPDVWTKGVGAEPPVIVCGEHAHYAVARAAGEMGLGLDAVVHVASRDHRMDVAALDETLGTLERANRRVMAVVATAGSTATGSFDDLDAIADRCETRGVWLHVDGAHGASALLAPEHAARVRGIERAHSIAWDPHKMLLLPMAAGVVLVRDERWLEAAFAQHAPYLFTADFVEGADPGDRVRDQGVRSFQCTRRADALKLWVAFQRYGADGLGALYAHLCDTTRALHDLLAAHPRFVPLHEPECNILCFRWVGDGACDEDDLDLVNARARARYNASGAGWITATVLGGRRVLRATVMNPRTTPAHLASLVDGLDAAARAEAASALRPA
ncbi:Pyridoxal-dependent decarboxylase [Gemmatirosa kalamazoonensis]|uniref:Pyridoxal-dependent decarboxylase n=1 Tax=Gemmatirosa kalamazoonensis TaxID=861299 RepID=W0RBF4_9BACT|nr:aminotransferase class V-fold PLP-dependent enzyme [Gemmatirosa kalamazoonensis]AHG88429.1 Pyridoxal-dependent decarboxylase [Gemmatirosa kalamazoonensis]